MKEREGPSVKTTLRVVAVVIAALLAVYLIYLLRTPLTWIVIAGFIAVAVSGPIRWLQQYMRRGLAVAVMFIGLLLVPVLLGLILVPPVVTEIQNLADRVPQYAQDVREFVRDNEQLRALEEDYDITGRIEEEAAKLPEKLGGAAGVLGDIGLGLVNSLFAGITIFILAIFLVGAGPGWMKSFIARRPEAQQPTIRRTADRIGVAIGGYCAGALGQAAVAGLTAWIVLTILGVPYAPALALIVAILDLVPLVGATLGAIVVGIVTLFNDFPTDTIVWAAYSIAYQQLENSVIQPRIQARAVQVEPAIVLIAVLFGSTLFGVLGALLAIPFAAAIQIGIREWDAYRASTRMTSAPEPKPATP